jgi:hypothetical protein
VAPGACAPGKVCGEGTAEPTAVVSVCGGFDCAWVGPGQTSAKLASPARPSIFFEVRRTFCLLSLAFIWRLLLSQQLLEKLLEPVPFAVRLNLGVRAAVSVARPKRPKAILQSRFLR